MNTKLTNSKYSKEYLGYSKQRIGKLEPFKYPKITRKFYIKVFEEIYKQFKKEQ